jgi:hypothetical protein
MWDLVSLDLPQALRVFMVFYDPVATQRNIVGAVFPILTAFSVFYKLSRIFWITILTINQIQKEQRAHARRSKALIEWSFGIQLLIPIIATHLDLPQEFALRFQLATRKDIKMDPNLRILEKFSNTFEIVYEVACLAIFQALWRSLRRKHNLRSSRSLRNIAQTLLRRPESKSPSSSKGSNLTLDAHHGEASHGLPNVELEAEQNELLALTKLYAKELRYLDEKKVTKILVTSEIITAMRAVWNSRIMQRLMDQSLDLPAPWHDRIVTKWPRELSHIPSTSEILSSLPLRPQFNQ